MKKTWCCRCQEYTESFVGSSVVRVIENRKIRITNLSCDKCHTFKESIVEEILIKENEVIQNEKQDS